MARWNRAVSSATIYVFSGVSAGGCSPSRKGRISPDARDNETRGIGEGYVVAAANSGRGVRSRRGKRGNVMSISSPKRVVLS